MVMRKHLASVEMIECHFWLWSKCCFTMVEIVYQYVCDDDDEMMIQE